MCGIAGIFAPDSPPSEELVQSMLNRIEHRGPDGRGILNSGPIVLGHVRLSILDLTDRAAQPMTCQAGRFSITFNGEIYNFSDLRVRLEAVGINPRSTGDTEVLLEHLAYFGVEDTLARVEGFFAFALWDSVEKVLLLARDRLGQKPLYWTVKNGNVRFASEAKALVDGSVRPDLTTLNAMLLGFSANWGRETVFEGIETLEPGSIVEFRATTTSPARRTWSSIDDFVSPELHCELRQMSESDVVDVVSHALEESLRYRMISDVPVASLVSGGVDSSLITVLASRQDQKPSLYHADVVGDSERVAATAVAADLASELNVTTVSDESLVDDVTSATWYNDQPLIYHVNAVPFMSVCRDAGADGVKVMLSGEGSDELFLGYPRYGLAPYLDKIETAKARVRSVLLRTSPRVTSQIWPSVAESYNYMLRQLVSRGEAARLDGLSEASASHLTVTQERSTLVASLSLLRSHLVSLLHRNDRLGMAAGIENRFPFLGRELMSIAVNLPMRYKLRWTAQVHDRRHPFVVDKWIVRRIAARHVSGAHASRMKRGFPVRIGGRLVVSPALFDDGFIANYWRIDRRAMAQIVEYGTPDWALRLALVEVWGRLYFSGASIEDTAMFLLRHTDERDPR